MDWDELVAPYGWLEPMKGCPQDAIFHAEGDVWTHVRMVCEAMAGLEEWRAMGERERDVLFAATLLHDVAKPVCTRVEEGRITSRGHSARGAIQARRILWDLGVEFAERELVCALVRQHQIPFHLLNRADSERTLFRISQTVRCDLLTVLARADLLGLAAPDLRALVFTVLVLMNVGLILVNRSFDSSLYGAMVRPNPALRLLTAAVLMLLGCALYLEPARRLFHFGILHVQGLLAALAIGLLLITILETAKHRLLRISTGKAAGCRA